MPRTHIRTICAVVASFMLAACTNEETDGRHTHMDEDIQPMVFMAVWQQPASTGGGTRVADCNNGSDIGCKWNDGDKIRVRVKPVPGASEVYTTCTLTANGDVASYAPLTYWQRRGRYTIRAWYSNIGDCPTTDTAVSIGDQSGGLAHVLKTTDIDHVYYDKKSSNVVLTFSQQLAKVRVRLVDKNGNAVNPATATVSIRNCHTACSIDNGDITPMGRDDGDVRMMPPDNADGYFEANVIPDDTGTIRQEHALEVTVNGKATTASLARPVTFERGKIYTLTIKTR